MVQREPKAAQFFILETCTSLPWGSQTQMIFTIQEADSVRERGLQSVQSQLPVRSHPPGRQMHSPSEGKVVARLEGSGINLSHLDSSRTNESRGRTIMVSRKYAVRINFCCRSCPTAPSGPEGGAIFHPGDVKLFPFWGPFTNDVRQGG